MTARITLLLPLNTLAEDEASKRSDYRWCGTDVPTTRCFF